LGKKGITKKVTIPGRVKMKNLNRWSGFCLKFFAIVSILCIAGLNPGNVQAAAPNSAALATLPSCPVVGSVISTDTVWNNDCVHVVNSNLLIQNGATLTIQEGTIVKVALRIYIDVQGNLILQGTADNVVKFTSIRDDTLGGDTNNDGLNTNPDRGDWDRIYLENNGVTFENTIVRYSDYGLVLYDATPGDFQPDIIHNTFEKNNFGLSLVVASNSNITSKISNNVFTGNNFGLATFQGNGVTGTSLPELISNDFNNNIILPIFLAGSAFPSYSGNSFIGYPTSTQRLGIGVGGRFTRSGTWENVNNMPYVVVLNTTIDSDYTITLPAKTILKFDVSKYLDVFGTLNIQSNQVGDETIFTSLKDDTGGDTNGDGVDSESLPGDWDSIYLHNDTTVFKYSIIKYATTGLTVYNTPAGNFDIAITHNIFSNNQNGLYYLTAATGLTEGSLSGNLFTSNTGFPIVLNGTAFPAYSGNQFTNNTHKAIAITGSWFYSGTWPDVVGDSDQVFPYVVVDYGNKGVTIISGSDITIPPGAVYKFDAGTYLDVQGSLIMGSTAQKPIIFTSFKDDSYKGDTNGDVSATLPAPGDWDAVYLENSSTTFHDGVVKYSVSGAAVWNTGSDDIFPAILNSTFTNNVNGVRLLTASTGNITSLIQNNQIISNRFGLLTGQGSDATGTSRPDLTLNVFSGNTVLPIYLSGSAFPNYDGNTFIGFPTANQRLGIGLAGKFTGDGTWVIINAMPYVVLDQTTISSGFTVSLPSGLIMKFDSGKYLDVFGTLDLQSTAVEPIKFTSFKDDSGGDTNGDGSATQPARSNWEAIYLENSSTSFHDAIVKYSSNGLAVYNTTSYTISPDIQNSRFEENNFGVVLDALSYGDVNSAITDNNFINNNYGLGTNSKNGLVWPTLANNTFSGSQMFPLYFNGTTEPVYIDNVFQNNVHPAIAVAGYWDRNVTWLALKGDNDKTFPYVVFEGDIVQEYGYTLTLPEGLVVKFDRDRSFFTFGFLNLQSTALNPIVFTSYYDDSVGGDTNADSGAASPAIADWKSVWLIDTPTKINQVHNIIGRYGTAAIGVFYSGPANTAVNTAIYDCLFENNHVGVVLAIAGSGNILSQIGKNNPNSVIFRDNNYGLTTYTFSQSIGYIQPKLINVNFANNKIFPLYLGGSTFLDVQTGNSITGSASSSQTVLPLIVKDSQKSIELEFPDTPGNQAMRRDIENSPRQPSGDNPAKILAGGSFSISALSPAIGLGGYFNQIGTLFEQDNLPYAVVGNYPLNISLNGVTDPASPHLLVGTLNPQASITFLPGTVLKFGPALYVDVFGKLDLQGTQSKPVMFTSIKDDSVGGDTNKDGSKTIPQKGDWLGIYLESSGTIFSNSVLKYATVGLSIYFSGEINTNINPEVKSSIFSNNTVGLSLNVLSYGDILSDIHNNLFLDNSTDITAFSKYETGHVMTTIHDNDLLGPTDFGINHQSTNWTIQAENNYWGDPSGPLHPSNSSGKGVKVSDYVDFTPWQMTPNFALKYSVSGRIITDDPIPVGLLGVKVLLSNGMSATTNAGGYYIFNGLSAGTYGVTPILSGYRFDPSSYVINCPPDATVPEIISHVSTQTTYSISGHVRENWGMPVNGVVIQLDNGTPAVTGPDGSYTFPNVLAGTYVITPSYSSFTITPISRTVKIGPDAKNQDFKVNADIGSHFLIYIPKLKK
jgi:hypothetical protein